MSILFASVAVVCTMSACSDYVLDSSTDHLDAVYNTQALDDEFLSIWGDEADLNKWLAKYQIGENVFEIVSLEFETQEIKESDIP